MQGNARAARRLMKDGPAGGVPGPRPADAIFRPALILMAGRVIGFVVAFCIPIILVRLFTQEEFGSYKQLFLIYGTLFGIAQFGLAESLFYFLPSERRHGGRFAFNTLAALGLIGFVGFAATLLLGDWIAGLMNNPALTQYMPYVGLYLLFTLASVLLEIVMTVRKQHLAASTVYALTDLLRTALYLIPVFLIGGLQALMMGAVGFAALRFVATLVYLRREFGASLRPSRPLFNKHLGYALPFGLAVVIEVLQGSFHMYAVSYYFDVATFAIYAVGCLQVPLFGFLTSSTANVMMTAMRERLMDGERKQGCEVWWDTVRKMALCIFPLIACLIVVAHDLIVLLFTEDYVRSVPIFMVWTATVAFAVLMTDSVLRVLAETRFLILMNLVQLLIIAATIPWFIGSFGLVGAVLVTLVSTLVRNVLALARIRRVLDLRVATLLPWRALASCLVMALLAMLPPLALAQLVDLPLLLSLAAGGLLYSLCYLALLLQWGPMQDTEKEMLLQWLFAPLLWAQRTRESH